MTLIDVYTDLARAIPMLYKLLAEREPHQSISHKRMPTYREHEDFVCSVPYAEWYMVMDGDTAVGAVYLTKAREIGIGIFKAYQGNKFATQAIGEVMRRHGPGKFFANINPKNQASVALFNSLGFDGPIQITLEATV